MFSFRFAPQIIRRAVSGMLPKNRLRQKRLDRLMIFADDDVGPAYEANLLKDYEAEFADRWTQSKAREGDGQDKRRTAA